MRAVRRVAALVLLTGLAAVACSGDDKTATDPPGSPVPTVSVGAVPVPSGPVSTRGLVTVIQQPSKPVEMCLGAITEIYPPQCTGPEVAGWDWDTTGQGAFEQEGDLRFGSYALTGRWDGTALTVTAAIPSALYDAAPTVEPSIGPPTRRFSRAGLVEIADEASSLPGALGTAVIDRRVHADVVYDDGSIQDYADRAWGAGVVVVSSALIDVG